MDQNDLVSIIIPTYNRKLYYLMRAINSVKRQTHRNIEIIVVDDNTSKSKYSAEIKNYCISNNIIYLKTKGEQGANIARNIGACYSTGTYLAFLDDDDSWLPDKLEIQLKYFTENIGMVYSNGYVVTRTSKYSYINPIHFICKGNLYRLLLYNYIGPTITALIKRQCFFDVGMFDENMPAKQDYDLWIRIVEKYEIIGINKPLYIYFQHDSHQMTQNFNLILKGYYRLYKKYVQYYTEDNVLLFFFYIKIAILFRYKKKYFKQCKFLFLAVMALKKQQLNTIF